MKERSKNKKGGKSKESEGEKMLFAPDKMTNKWRKTRELLYKNSRRTQKHNFG